MSIDKGNTANRLTWQSGTKTRDKGATIQLIYQGKYTALEAIQPEKADVLTGYAGYEVDKSHIVPQKGGMGILTIDMVEVAESVGTKPVGSISSVIEIEMAQLEKPIMTHQDFRAYAADVEMWRSEADAKLRSEYKYTDGAATINLVGSSLKAARLILKGVESFLTFAPVISRTSTYKSRPTPADYGKICTPPTTVPGSWVYLKTADRIVQQTDKTYQRTEQWTGAEEWSTDLYEST